MCLAQDWCAAIWVVARTGGARFIPPTGFELNDNTQTRPGPTCQTCAPESGNMMQQATRAMATGLNHEMTQVQDRKMDLADNEQGRKNLDTEYNRQIEMEKLIFGL